MESRNHDEAAPEKSYAVAAEWSKRAFIDEAKYREMYARSTNDPKGFWADQARRIDWYHTPTKIENSSFAPGHISIKVRDALR